MALKLKIESLDAEACKKELRVFLTTYCSPAFGSLPKREVDLLVFDMLRNLGVVKNKASLFDLMTALKVSRAKASSLLLETELRNRADEDTDLDAAIAESLIGTKFGRDGKYFIVEIENPLVREHCKDKIRSLGHISDASFSSTIMRLPLDAMTALIIDLIAEEKQDAVRDALIKAGAPNRTFRGVVTAALKTLGGKIVGEAADDIAEQLVKAAPSMMRELLNGTTKTVTKAWKGLF